MPLAALTPLAIISGCLTVAGVGMHLNHWLFTGEEGLWSRDRLIKKGYIKQ
ncbi:hypothetical protein EMIHUDRAFT_194723 [Emiliania huxleyi CCMP1516]|uniref:Uncharacterized protein n=2 Tax=Emiliania huxleyi TaxID=2903 RepID=A0A0D3L203_EMIH1|nr:hypothetical protein EMIHUDRAFT_194723 [Emiliania huxleyi CCMP1516]EOD42038.1 hypothetical protein EMIHUDRAFT_194723 [Emiliania huxleyi CCMP1516]|eukprot:XP_005794467.1 hypothetical protein EMIHUDRAFT_194723 [Emiliania huxleyi CCMP1516]